MDADEAIERLRSGYASFNRGEIERVLEDLDPDISIEERAEAPDPRSGKGRHVALEAFHSLQQEFVDYQIEPREFHVEGEHVIVEARQSGTGRLSGVPVEGDIVHAWRVSGDQVSELRAFSTLEQALEAIRADAGEPAEA